MFDPEFFPTPEPVIRQMLQPYAGSDGKHEALQELNILDPSAGSGSILKHVLQYFTSYATVDAVEINPACHALLKEHERINLVHDDFLTFKPEVRYDLILMNPPFSNGDRHLLKAWEIMTRGDIVCLLNAETVRNPHTARRKQLAAIIKEHGTVEYIGQAFQEAERRTDVEVALVRLAVQKKEDPFSFWNDSYFARERFEFNVDENTLDNAPAVNDLVKAMVQQYGQVGEVFIEYMKAKRRLIYHATPVIEATPRGVPNLLEQAEGYEGDPERIYQKFMAGLTKQAWASIMLRTKLQDLMTESVRKDFDSMQEEQGSMAFTEENIRGLFELLFLNRHKILQRSVVESFDLMTRYYKENCVHVEGWKSNEAFKVSRKVVLPCSIERGFSRSFGIDYCRRASLVDIDRGIAMVDGKKLGQVKTIARALEERFAEMDGVPSGAIPDNTCTSTYFHIRFFKKGTIHLTWLDEGLWNRFNIAAAQGKNWLPMDYGRKPEANAQQDEQQHTHRAQQLLLN